MFIPPLITNLFDYFYTPKYNCPICLEDFNSDQGSVHTKCNHKFCIDCYTKHSSRGGDVSCPICRQKIIACEKNNHCMYNDFTDLVSVLEEEDSNQNMSKMELAWKSEEDETVYYAWIFGNKTKESSRSTTPIIEISDEERQKIFIENINNLQKNITDTCIELNKYGPS